MKDSLSPSNFGITRGLVGKLQDTLGYGILKSNIFEEVPTEDIDDFVKLLGNGLRAAWVEILRQRFQLFSRSAKITMNFDDPGLFEQAMKVAGFTDVDCAIKLSDIPMPQATYGLGNIEQRVFGLCLGKEVYNGQLPAAFEEKKLEIGFPYILEHVDPLTFIAYATRERRRSVFMFATLFYGWCMYCTADNILYITRRNDQLKWDERTQFLVVSAEKPVW